MNQDKIQNLKELLALANKPYFSVEEGAKMFAELAKFIKDLKQTNEGKYNELVTELSQILKDHNRLTKDVSYSEVYFKNEISSLKNALSKLKLQHGKDGKDADPVDTRGIALEASKMAQEAIKPLLATIPTSDEIVAKIPIVGEKVRDSLELLKGEERLDAKAIKNLPKAIETGVKYYGGTGLIKGLRAGTNITIDNSIIDYPLITSAGGSESDPVFNAWILATPPLYSEADTLATVVARGNTINDNIKIRYGTGDDASIYYDGTNLNINPKEVGSGGVKISGGLLVTDGVLEPFNISTSGLLDVSRSSASTNTIFSIARLWRGTTGTPASGIGGAFSMLAKNSAGEGANMGYFGARLLNVTNGSEIGELGLFPDWQDSKTLTTRSFLVRAISSTIANAYLPADNASLIFGAGEDASIYYDGTNMVINPKVVGSGIVSVLGEVKATGYQSSDGTAGLTATKVFNDGAVVNTVTIKNGLITSWTQV